MGYVRKRGYLFKSSDFKLFEWNNIFAIKRNMKNLIKKNSHFLDVSAIKSTDEFVYISVFFLLFYKTAVLVLIYLYFYYRS